MSVCKLYHLWCYVLMMFTVFIKRYILQFHTTWLIISTTARSYLFFIWHAEFDFSWTGSIYQFICMKKYCACSKYASTEIYNAEGVYRLSVQCALELTCVVCVHQLKRYPRSLLIYLLFKCLLRFNQMFWFRFDNNKACNLTFW